MSSECKNCLFMGSAGGGIAIIACLRVDELWRKSQYKLIWGIGQNNEP